MLNTTFCQESRFNFSTTNKLENTKKLLQKAYNLINKWHKDNFGTRKKGLNVKLPDLGSKDYYKMLYYQRSLKSIRLFAESISIDLMSPTTSTVRLAEAIDNKKELIMDTYDLGIWKADTTKAYHIIMHLAKYLGFDPLTFTALNDEIFAEGAYKRHHFLAFMFKKMNSQFGATLLTDDIIHAQYEQMFNMLGDVGAQNKIESLLASLEELVALEGHIEESDMERILTKNFGIIEGKKILTKWKSQPDFIESIATFNERKNKVESEGYAEYLASDYDIAYNSYVPELENVILTQYLGTSIDMQLFGKIRMSIYGRTIYQGILGLLGQI